MIASSRFPSPRGRRAVCYVRSEGLCFKNSQKLVCSGPFITISLSVFGLSHRFDCMVLYCFTPSDTASDSSKNMLFLIKVIQIPVLNFFPNFLAGPFGVFFEEIFEILVYCSLNGFQKNDFLNGTANFCCADKIVHRESGSSSSCTEK